MAVAVPFRKPGRRGRERWREGQFLLLNIAAAAQPGREEVERGGEERRGQARSERGRRSERVLVACRVSSCEAEGVTRREENSTRSIADRLFVRRCPIEII